MGGGGSQKTEVVTSPGQELAFAQANSLLAQEQQRLNALQGTLTQLQPFVTQQVGLLNSPDRSSRIAYAILNGETPTPESIGARALNMPAPIQPKAVPNPWETRQGLAIKAALDANDPAVYYREMGLSSQLTGKRWQQDAAAGFAQVQQWFDANAVRPYQQYVQQLDAYNKTKTEYDKAAAASGSDAAWQEDMFRGQQIASYFKRAHGLSEDLANTDYYQRFTDLVGQLDEWQQQVPDYNDIQLPLWFQQMQARQQETMEGALRKQLGTGWEASTAGALNMRDFNDAQATDAVAQANEIFQSQLTGWQARGQGLGNQLDTELNLYGQKAQDLYGNLTAAYGINDLSLSEQAKRLGVSSSYIDTIVNSLTQGNSISFGGLAQQYGALGGQQAAATQGGTIVTPADNTGAQLAAGGATAAAGIASAIIIAA